MPLQKRKGLPNRKAYSLSLRSIVEGEGENPGVCVASYDYYFFFLEAAFFLPAAFFFAGAFFFAAAFLVGIGTSF